MPITSTITSFYSFTSTSKAKASEVNTNFDALRGHFLPIDPNTGTAATTKTYDLGSSDHKWNNIYSQNIDINLTTTTQSIISGESTGAISFKSDNSSKFKITDDGYIGINLNDMDFVSGSTTTVGNIAISSVMNMTVTTTSYIAGSTCTLMTSGRPVLVGFQYESGFFRLLTDMATPFIDKYAYLSFVMNGVQLAQHKFGLVAETSTKMVTNNLPRLPSNSFSTIVLPSAGENIFSIRIELAAGVHLQLKSVCLTAREF